MHVPELVVPVGREGTSQLPPVKNGSAVGSTWDEARSGADHEPEVAHLKVQGGSVKYLTLSGFAQIPADRALDNGHSLSKPWDTEVRLRTVRALLERPREPD